MLQGGFSYSLYRSGETDPICDWLQLESEPYPLFAIVHDSGWFIVHLKNMVHDYILIGDPSGTDFKRLNLLKRVPAQHCVPTTAGLIWGELSHWQLLEWHARIYLSIRPWWNERIFVDLAGGCFLADDEALASLAQSGEAAFTLRQLKAYTGLAKSCPNEGMHLLDREGAPDWADLCRAIYLAGTLHLEEAVPALRVVERLSEQTMKAVGNHVHKGRIDPNAYEIKPLRTLSHLSLRRLGEIPSSPPALCVLRLNEKGEVEPYQPERIVSDRAQRIGEVCARASPEKVVEALGHPDRILGPPCAWEYDMDERPPFTVRVEWRRRWPLGRSYVAAAVRKLTPPAWDLTRRENFQAV